MLITLIIKNKKLKVVSPKKQITCIDARNFNEPYTLQHVL